jgi:hypothetical protein
VSHKSNFAPTVLPLDVVPFSDRRCVKGSLTSVKRGKLQIVKAVGRRQSPGGHWATWYECRCSCRPRRKVFLSSGSLNAGAISCGCSRKENVRRGSTHPFWSGCGDITGRLWNQIICGARSRNIPVELTIDEVWALFLQQDRKCALTGMVLTMPSSCKSRGTASLDRIDSSKIYTLSNVQWVHMDVNLMKQQLDESYFVRLCTAVANGPKSGRAVGLRSR